MGLFSWRGDELHPVVVRSFRSQNYTGLEPLVREFLGEDLTNVTRACFGVPCPIEDGRCEAPNLPWVLSAGELQRDLQIPELFLINDLEATAYGIPMLKNEEVVTLNEGNPVANRHSALIAAGTGLGEAILFWNGERHVPAASEGGHADFAPRSPIEIELLQYLQ
ncbi:MAG: glucokinase, partial [Acidobacteria bacterium]|nr:glucokinase [Acidobacteriota bacterium]